MDAPFEFLVFQLNAPLASFGNSMGLRRTTDTHPRQSVITGLLAAALGIEHGQDAEFKALAQAYRMGVAELSAPRVMTDYHTVSAPVGRYYEHAHVRTKKESRAQTRIEQFRAIEGVLAAGGKYQNTMETRRDYLQNGKWLVAVQADPAVLQALASALQHPAFTLSLGRKSCVLAAYTAPVVVQEPSIEAAMRAWARVVDPRLSLEGVPLFWDASLPAETRPVAALVRTDVRLSLSANWFAERLEKQGTIENCHADDTAQAA